VQEHTSDVDRRLSTSTTWLVFNNVI